MAWNEPPNDEKDKRDPWTSKREAPPDLDEALKALQRKIRTWMGGNRHGSGGSAVGQGGNGFGIIIGFFVLVALVLWILSGIFIVRPAEQAVILRFGKYHRTVGPGPHWVPRLIETAYVRNVDRRTKYTYSAQMLTKDENIVQVSLSVIYRIGNLNDYLFNVVNPVESLQQATASALRQVVGHTTLDEIITKGREVWGQKVDDLLSSILKDYKVGIVVVNVSPQPARAPDKVQDAFDDAITAQEDEKRFIEKAKSYSEKVLPIARGNAKRILSEAQADEAAWVLKAKGAVAEFLALLPRYQAAPKVVRERMYLDTIEQVLSHSTKIFVDVAAGNMIYLPVDRLRQQTQASDADLAKLSAGMDLHQDSDDDTTTVSAPTLRSSHNTRLHHVADYGSRF